jgi:clan AA aspartic protease (TIGR02281 family)
LITEGSEDHVPPPAFEDRTFQIVLGVLVLIMAAVGGFLFWYFAPQPSAYVDVYSALGIQELPATIEVQPQVRVRLDQLRREQCSTEAALGLSRALDNVGHSRTGAIGLVNFAKRCSTYDLSNLPVTAASSESIRRPLEQIIRERCDKQAILDLGTALENAGYRREASNSHMSFSRICGGYASSLRKAANIMLELSDYAGATAAASELINLEPLYDNGYYLRALARDGDGLAEKAIDDYVTTLELAGNKDNIIGTPYFKMARLYGNLGRFCDAIVPIEAWVSLDPRHDSSQTQTIINNYMTKGKCAAETSGRMEVFPISRPNDVINLPVTVNGVRGTFVLDTGATFVSLKNSFAQKTGVEIDEASVIHLHTANGIAEGKRGRAERVQLRSLVAKDVPIIVHSTGAYGEGIDGLLGMSFLSRFSIKIDTRSVNISTRKAP